MRSLIKTRRKPALKELAILHDLRKQIVDGKYQPGCQLPNRREMEQQYGVSPVTLQKVLHQLKQDGFVLARAGQGTFIAPNPPHLTHYCLVFPSDPAMKNWISFYQALNNEGLNYQRSNPGRLTQYYGLEHPARHESREALIADVRAHRVAGLIFVSPPYNFADTPLLDEPGMARVCIADYPGIPNVKPDYASLLGQALDYLASQGRKRIAVLTAYVEPSFYNEFSSQVRMRGMSTNMCWHQAVQPYAAHWARNATEMLFQPHTLRPDGLLIVDDNLVPFATAGLASLGVRVPDDLTVVSHCNFPWPTQSVVPCRRVGWDVRAILKSCMEVIDAQRQGQDFVEDQAVAAVMDEEPAMSI